MPKIVKKNPVKKITTVEELNKPIAKKGWPKSKSLINWFKLITLVLLTVIAVSSSYIAYELQNTSYRISTYNSAD